MTQSNGSRKAFPTLSIARAEYTCQCVGLVAQVTGLIIGVVGAFESSYYSKEYNEYHALTNQLDTRKASISN